MHKLVRSFLFGVMVVVPMLSCASLSRADEVATVQFTGVSSSCNAPFGPCDFQHQEVWSGSFSVDLLTGQILSDSLTGVGPGNGPWLGGEAGTFLNPECLPSAAFHGPCAILWHDAQGWILQWDPGDDATGILDSSGKDFFGMGQFPSIADTYSVSTPEPSAIFLLCAGAGFILAWRSRHRTNRQPAKSFSVCE
jgi:hypothetical protein